jgi:hypothetical protein
MAAGLAVSWRQILLSGAAWPVATKVTESSFCFAVCVAVVGKLCVGKAQTARFVDVM